MEPKVEPTGAPTTSPEPAEVEARDRIAVPSVIREILVVVIGYAAYTFVRKATTGGETSGLRNARHLAHWESSLHIDMERSFNNFFSDHRFLASLSGWYYATFHFVVTIGVLVWLYRARPEKYRLLRTGLMVCNYAALLIFLTWPLAPPRLAEKGFDDIVVSAHIWGSFANKNLASTADQYAAMPSLHTAWSLWSGLALALYAKHWWARVLGILYPLTTVTVIMGTGNHYILDAVAGAALLLASMAVAPWVVKAFDAWHVAWLNALAHIRVRT